MSRSDIRDFQNLETKCLPRSETMSEGVPCFEKTCRRNSIAISSAVASLCVGMNNTIFDNRHTTTRIVSKSLDGGKPSIKSMEMESQGRLGTGRNFSGP